MVIAVLLFCIFIMEILLEEIGSYIKCTENLEKHKAELELMKIQKKFEETKGHLSVLNNPITAALYNQQIADIEKLEAQCIFSKFVKNKDKLLVMIRYNEAIKSTPFRRSVFNVWSAIRLLFPILIAIPLYWVNVKLDLDYRLIHPLDNMLYGRGREYGILYTKMHYYVVFVYAAHHRIKEILTPIC